MRSTRTKMYMYACTHICKYIDLGARYCFGHSQSSLVCLVVFEVLYFGGPGRILDEGKNEKLPRGG